MKCENLTLTNTEARALLVNRGEIIKTIQMETGARIVVEAHSNRKDRRIQVVGFEKTVTSAKLKIKEALCKMKCKTLFLTNDQVGALLANKAEIIRTIEEDTATSITVKGRSQCDGKKCSDNWFRKRCGICRTGDQTCSRTGVKLKTHNILAEYFSVTLKSEG